MVDSGSPRLRITKSGWQRQKSQTYEVYQRNICRFITRWKLILRPSSQSWNCVKSSNGLGNMTVQSLFNKNCLKHGSENRKIGIQLLSANLVFAFVGVCQAQIFGCACLKRKWTMSIFKWTFCLWKFSDYCNSEEICTLGFPANCSTMSPLLVIMDNQWRPTRSS